MKYGKHKTAAPQLEPNCTAMNRNKSKKWNIENRMRHRKELTEKVNEKDSERQMFRVFGI